MTWGWFQLCKFYLNSHWKNYVDIFPQKKQKNTIWHKWLKSWYPQKYFVIILPQFSIFFTKFLTIFPFEKPTNVFTNQQKFLHKSIQNQQILFTNHHKNFPPINFSNKFQKFSIYLLFFRFIFSFFFLSQTNYVLSHSRFHAHFITFSKHFMVF